MYGEQEALLSLGSLQLMPYGLCMAGGALLALMLTMWSARKTGVRLESALSVVLLGIVSAVLGGHLVYCMAMFPVLEADYGGIDLIWHLERGGYTLFGAVFGVLLALYLFHRKTGIGFDKLLDLAAPGAMAAICAGRAAEYFNGQGLGSFVEPEAFQRFPFAVCTYMEEDWAEWYVCVFFFEALTALVLCGLAVYLLGRRKEEGRTGTVILTLLCTTQVFLEQLRQDDCIRFGFVRFTQLAALAVLLGVLAVRLIRERRATGRIDVFDILELLAVVLVVIFVEFCLEKPQFLPWLQISSLLMGVAVLVDCLGRKRPVPGIAVMAVSAAFAVCLFLGLEWENTLLYLFMAFSLVILAWTVLRPFSRRRA